MVVDYKKDGQPILFPEDENTVEVVEDEVAEVESGGGGTGRPRQFSALPPLPDGDEVPIAMYAERAYLEYASRWSKAAPCPTSATDRSQCSAASCLQCARWA